MRKTRPAAHTPLVLDSISTHTSPLTALCSLEAAKGKAWHVILAMSLQRDHEVLFLKKERISKQPSSFESIEAGNKFILAEYDAVIKAVPDVLFSVADPGGGHGDHAPPLCPRLGLSLMHLLALFSEKTLIMNK